MSVTSYRSASRARPTVGGEEKGPSNLFGGQAVLTWLDTKLLQHRRHGFAMDAQQCGELLRRPCRLCKRSLERGLGEVESDLVLSAEEWIRKTQRRCGLNSQLVHGVGSREKVRVEAHKLHFLRFCLN